MSLENLINEDFIIDLLVFFSLNSTNRRIIITFKISILKRKIQMKIREREKQHKMEQLLISKQLQFGAIFHLINLCDISKIDEKQDKWGDTRDGNL